MANLISGVFQAGPGNWRLEAGFYWNRTILWFCMMKAASVYREFPSYNDYVLAVIVGEGEGGARAPPP